MIQKIFSLKNKILAVLLIVLVSAIIYIISIDKYNQDFFLKTIENKLNLEINNKGSYNINFFPKFHLIQKDLEIFKKFNNYSILSRNIDIDLIKKYLNWNKTFFQRNSLSTVVKGITIRNIEVNIPFTITAYMDDDQIKIYGITEIDTTCFGFDAPTKFNAWEVLNPIGIEVELVAKRK